MGFQFHANIKWIPPEQGGRTIPLAGSPYRPTVELPEWPIEGCLHWSVQLEFLQRPTGGWDYSQARLSFVVPEAPAERIRPGMVLSLFEGRKVVAEAIITSSLPEVNPTNSPNSPIDVTLASSAQ